MTLGAGQELLRGLLDLHEVEAPAALVDAALRLLLSATGALRGHVSLEDPDGRHRRGWEATSAEASAAEAVRVRISSGVVAMALATGSPVHTTSAAADPRFADRESVRTQRLEAILCAPVIGVHVRGVVYVEGTAAGGPFTPEAEAAIERFARVLAIRGDALLDREALARGLDGIPGVVAASPAMQGLVARLRAVAPLDVLVLLTGPTGTGKTHLARSLHQLSHRADGPFVEVNCGALPENLVESELFGAARGAHSAVAHGAVQGKIAAAEGGTLFLDEVAELPLSAQPKLLQFLDARVYSRLGDPARRTANVRIIAASNVELERAVAEKRLRSDLYHRLAVVRLEVPPLAARPEDIAPLARQLAEEVRVRHGYARLNLSPAALGALEAAPLPGNVRELAHLLEAGAVAAAVAGRSTLVASDVFPDAAPGGAPRTLEAGLLAHRALLVRAALQESNWNVAEAASQLDIARSYLYKLIEYHRLARPQNE